MQVQQSLLDRTVTNSDFQENGSVAKSYVVVEYA